MVYFMKTVDILIIVLLVIAVSAIFLLFFEKPLYVDENTHYSVISGFCNFNYTYPDFLTTIPGYHFIAGLFGYLTSCTESSIRFFNFLISIASIIVFFYLTKELGLKNYREKALCFIFLPILLPYFILIYTDVMSLLFILLMFYFLLRENYIFSGVFGLLSFVVRQNNIIWVLFCITYILTGKSDSIKNVFSNLRNPASFKKVLPYIIVLLIALTFFLKNGGFSIGDKTQHPTLFIGFMNVYTALFFIFWINLPEHLMNLKPVFSRIGRMGKKNIAILLASIALFFLFYLYTFKIDHPYNIYSVYSYFLRNKILHFFDSSLLLRSAFFVSIILAILSIYSTKFKEKRQYMAYFFSFVFLSASWLIENRYFIIPFVLFNLFAVRDLKRERSLFAWYILGSAAYLYLFYTGWTFW